MELEGQPLGLNLSEQESPSFLRRRPPLRKLIKHSTPEEAEFSWSLRLPGDALDLNEEGPAGGSPVPGHSFPGLRTCLAGVSWTTTFRRRRLSTIWASSGSSGHSRPDEPLSAPGGDLPIASLLAQQQQRQQGESLHTSSWPRISGLPGISNTSQRKRRNLKKLAAVMERVRQWEWHLLQNIEEATQHQLTVQIRETLKSQELQVHANNQHQTSQV
nr:coiled-coil domain-containing protein 201 [Oryctolagus cuniculus]